MLPWNYRPTPKIVRSPRASKISTDECINIRKSWTLKDAFFASKWGSVKILLKNDRIM